MVPLPFEEQNATLVVRSPFGDSTILLDFDPPLLQFGSPPMVLLLALVSRLRTPELPFDSHFRLAGNTLPYQKNPSLTGRPWDVGCLCFRSNVLPQQDHGSLESRLFW